MKTSADLGLSDQAKVDAMLAVLIRPSGGGSSLSAIAKIPIARGGGLAGPLNGERDVQDVLDVGNVGVVRTEVRKASGTEALSEG